MHASKLNLSHYVSVGIGPSLEKTERKSQQGLLMSLLCTPPPPKKKKKKENRLVSSDHSQYKKCVFTNLLFIETDSLKNAVVAFLFQLYRQGGSNEWTQH